MNMARTRTKKKLIKKEAVKSLKANNGVHRTVRLAMEKHDLPLTVNQQEEIISIAKRELESENYEVGDGDIG